jgi:hypothetical protein
MKALYTYERLQTGRFLKTLRWQRFSLVSKFGRIVHAVSGLPFRTNNNMRHWTKSILFNSGFCNNLNIVQCLFNCQIKVML